VSSAPVSSDPLKVALLTREYPPEVYGGAGVHVEYLARALSGLVDPPVEVTVHCQGAPRDTAVAHQAWPALQDAALKVFSADLSMADAAGGADLVHSHTWYANLAGHLASLLYGIPHVATVHSLEPLRPWKAEQLGGGYALSSWAERTALSAAAAVVAVSDGMRADVLSVYPEIAPERVRVIRNGIDTVQYAPDPARDVLARHGLDLERPYVIFVGRITRQKGVPVLLRAAAGLDPEAQLVLCAGAADTPELGAEVATLVAGLQDTRSGVLWIPEMLPKAEVIQLLTHALAFVCPSVYEPLGIVNLEAMGCATAVVASRVGGIPEVVDDGVTGLLVSPDDPAALADALNALLRDPGRAAAMGLAGRKRAVSEFSWDAVAAQTAELYAELTQALPESLLELLPDLLPHADGEQAGVVACVGDGGRQDAGHMAVKAVAVRVGAVRVGSVRVGSVRVGSVRVGSVRVGSVRVGSVRVGVGLVTDLDGGGGELGQRVADRGGPALDEPVGVKQQGVAAEQRQPQLLVDAFWPHPE
jgi:alpha-maltose-1-phosphate synthase